MSSEIYNSVTCVVCDRWLASAVDDGVLVEVFLVRRTVADKSGAVLLAVVGCAFGCIVEFLTVDQLQRYQSVKTKTCGNKAVDVSDLNKHGMVSIVEALERMKWTGLCTFFEPSYTQLVKAFYTCLQSEDEATLDSIAAEAILATDLNTEAPSTQAVESDVMCAETAASIILERRIADIPPEHIETIESSMQPKNENIVTELVVETVVA
ncbi:hypothetical protein Taro_016223, partial [Colocasia esculenta]|nr:hypothetical protein [Colocasia esculenta]